MLYMRLSTVEKTWMQPNMHFLWTVCVLVFLIIHFNIYCTIIFFLMIKSHLQLSSVILQRRQPPFRQLVYPEHKKKTLVSKCFRSNPVLDPHTLSLFLKQWTIIFWNKKFYVPRLSQQKSPRMRTIWTMHVKTYLRHPSSPLHKISFSKFHEMGHAALSHLVTS